MFEDTLFTNHTFHLENMDFTFEPVLTPDSETYIVKIDGKNKGTVLYDKQQAIWAAILPSSQKATSQNFENKQLAAEHLAELAKLS